MSTEPNAPPTPPEELKTEIVWWHMMGIGALFFAGAVFIWFYITNIEEGGGGGRIHWLLAVLYRWGGKWLCVAVVAVFGVGFTAAGVAALIKKSQGAAKDEDEEEEAP